MDIGAHIIVSGLVQGVGYRYFIYRRAVKYGLNGYAKNLPNGDVEMYVEGNRSLIEEFISDAKRGPFSAQVNDMRIEWKPVDHQYPGFHIQ